MQKVLTTVFAAAVLVAAAPAYANADVLSENDKWTLEQFGLDAIPDEGTATVYTNNGVEEVSFEELLVLIDERAGGVNLAELTSAPAEDDTPAPAAAAGDVWVIEFGSGDCTEPDILIEDSPLNGQSVGDAYTFYDNSDIGTMTSPGGTGEIIDNTNGETHAYEGEATLIGHSDFWCSSIFGTYFFFPFLDGIAYAN